MELWTAFTFGLLGSLHCIGMCGPIALALPSYEKKSSLFLNRFIYNVSRSISYGILGLVFGLIGSGASLFGMQQDLSIFSGVLILFFVFFPKIWTNTEGKLYQSPLIRQLNKTISKVFKSKSKFSQFSIGFLNGFLPCGFVYIALVASINQNHLIDSVLYMILFGLGTLPLMLLYSISAGRLMQIKGLNWFRLRTSLSVLVAVLFIIRGLSLDIPYLSPVLKIKNQEEHVSCCD